MYKINKNIKSFWIYVFFVLILYILYCFENKRIWLIGKLIKWNVLNVVRNFYKILFIYILVFVVCDGSIRLCVFDYRILEVVIWGVFLWVNVFS